MPAPLETFLHAVTSGHNVLSQEMYDHFGGAAILEALRKYDPDARFTETQMPGEAGGTGYRLDFDWSKLPETKAGKDWSINPSNLHDHVKNPNAVYDDPVYGSVTNSANFYKDADATWTKLAPIAVGMLAPMAGAALAGAGIGGTAGLTAGVTASVLGGAGTIPAWAAKLIAKAPQLAGQIDNGQWQNALQSILMSGGTAAGLPMNTIKAGITLAQLAKGR